MKNIKLLLKNGSLDDMSLLDAEELIWGELKNFEEMKSKLTFKIMNRKKNTALLKSVPHREYGDLAIVFYLLLRESREEIVTMTVTNYVLKRCWKITMEELERCAYENAKQILPAELHELPLGIGENNKMYILTNSIKRMGAACIFYPGIQEMLAEKIKEDFYLLPSSIHEWIILPSGKESEKGIFGFYGSGH